MLICKAEIPIENNEYLYQREENADIIKLDNSKGIEINRYTFSCDDIDFTIKTSYLIKFLSLELETNIYSILSWEKAPKNSKIVGIRIKKKLLRENYLISEKNKHYAAIKKIEKLEKWPFFLDDPLLRIGEFLIFSNIPLNNISKYITNKDTLFVAETLKFIPTKANIELFAKNDMSIIYISYDDLNNKEIILITKKVVDLKKISLLPNCMPSPTVPTDHLFKK